MRTIPAWRLWLITATAIAIMIVVAQHDVVPQDLSYHQFADQRTVFGVPNFWNVASSLPFLLVGIAGLLALHGRTLLKSAHVAFFVGAILISVGSAYYHLQPDNTTLIWDRLPMTVSFMAFVAIVIGKQIDMNAGRHSLLPLLCIGAASVAYWWLRDDLRPYVVVQFLPMVILPMILLLFPSQPSKDAICGRFSLSTQLRRFSNYSITEFMRREQSSVAMR